MTVTRVLAVAAIAAHRLHHNSINLHAHPRGEMTIDVRWYRNGTYDLDIEMVPSPVRYYAHGDDA